MLLIYFCATNLLVMYLSNKPTISDSPDPFLTCEYERTTSSKSDVLVIVPKPVDNKSNKSAKAHAVCNFLTNGSVNPTKIFVSKTICRVSSQSVVPINYDEEQAGTTSNHLECARTS